MRAMPYNLQGKGVVAEVTGKWNKVGCSSNEPTSVLDTRRSPSPTSTSTPSSSLGGSSDTGGGGGVGGGAVAAVSGEGSQIWPQIESCATGDGGRKEEWASDLQPIPLGLEIGNDKCGLGMDWESMWPESAASPGREHSILSLIMRDMDDPSSGLKHGGSAAGSSEFEEAVPGDPGFGVLVDSGPGFGFPSDAMGGGTVPVSHIGGFGSMPRISNPASNNSTLPAAVNAKLPCFNVGSGNSLFSSSPNLPLPFPFLNSQVFYQQHPAVDSGFKMDSLEDKPQLYHPQIMNQSPSQNPGFYVPLSFAQVQQQTQQETLLPPQPKRHQPLFDPQQLNQNWPPPPPVKQECQIPANKVPFSDSGQEIFLRRQLQPPQLNHPQAATTVLNHQNFAASQLHHHFLPHSAALHSQQRPKPKVGSDEAQQQAMVDQLFNAAELVENGNSIHARAILARLNHQLFPVGKPRHRAAFYFKEALHLLLISNSSPPLHRTSLSSSPLDVVLKIGAYKVFSEVSPLLQFAHFTCNQALLETLDGFNPIHIIDFEIGLGGQWASFMQEIALKLGNTPSLKITAFTSPASHDPLELSLTRENLTHFANDLNISFEFNVLNLEPFDPSMLNISDNEAVAVNFPIGSHLSYASNSIPSLLRLVKQISPKIVVSIDRGCDRSDLSFSYHFLHALHSYSVLLDSLDAMNVNSDVLHKIERFLIQPRIESIIAGRHRAEKIPPWRSLFLSAGFTPVPFSNFTETQAEWVLKRLQVRGFHIEKNHTSLLLCWQRGELVSASAWRC